jgi:hypothetical protein
MNINAVVVCNASSVAVNFLFIQRFLFVLVVFFRPY